MFRPIQRITTADPQGRLLLDLIGAGIGLYSPHTGYDSAALGINRQLAELIGLQDVKPLRPLPRPPQVKIVCFVPRTNLETVQHALWDSGAGRIGDYSQCSFYGPGTGTFHGSENSKPAIGQAGRLEQADEVRLEVVCSREYAEQAVAKMLAVHPYEEPAVDVYSLQSSDGDEGAGRFGTLSEEMSLDKFLEVVKRVLRLEHLQFVGDPQAVVRRAAIACGSGGEFLQDAVRCECDVLLTGETRFHAALEARTAGVGLVLAGHYATERPAMERLSEVLTLQFPELTVWASRIETDPLEWA